MAVDLNALLMYDRLSEWTDERYFVPTASKYKFGVKPKTPPKQWATSLGATEMEFQRYVPLFTIDVTPLTTAVRSSDIGITFYIDFVFKNFLGDMATVTYSLPLDIWALRVIGFGSPEVQLVGGAQSGTIYIPPNGTETLPIQVQYTKEPFGHSDGFKGLIFPASCFTYNGNPWTVPVSADVKVIEYVDS